LDASPAREKWLSILQPLAELPQKFMLASEASERQTIMQEASSRLASLGATHRPTDRALYSAANPSLKNVFASAISKLAIA